jgi:Fe-S cluster biogenesis protein NfuA
MNFLQRLFGNARGAPRASADDVPGDPQRVAAVLRVLDALRPMFAMDGGDVELLAVEDRRVRVRFVGACSSCSLQDTTLEGALVPRLRAELAWFEGLDVASS